MNNILYEKVIDYITKNQEKFYRLAYSYVRNQEAALDIVQNSIVKALEKYNEIRNPQAIRTWFYRVIVNESLTYLRQNERVSIYEPEIMNGMREEQDKDISESNHNPFIQELEETDLYEKVNCLPFNLKTVIMLRFYEDMSLKEIADITNTKLSTVKYRLYTAISKLKLTIEEEAL